MIISILFFVLSKFVANVSADIYKHVIYTLRTQARLVFRHTQNQCLALKVLTTSSVQEASVLRAFFANPSQRQGIAGDAASNVSQWGQNSGDPRWHEVIKSAALAGNEIHPCAVSRFNASFRAKEGFKQGIGFVVLCTEADLSPGAQCAVPE